MKTVGLITEYNPFHNGHRYHLEQSKKITNADNVIVVMSGNFLQRGIPAITDKYTRAKMALSQGADLVIELPATCATASAEFFAYGGISLLESLGCIDSICFGCECTELTLMQSIADILLKEPPTFRTILRKHLKNGISYPKARALALSSCFSEDEQLVIHAILSNPNNILGIEYLKAIKKIKSRIVPFIIPRIENQYHDTELSHNSISSATSIRLSYLKEHNLCAIEEQIPFGVFSILKEAANKTFPFHENSISSLLYYKLLSLSDDELQSFADVGIDLTLRIKKYLPQFRDFHSFCQLVKPKQYTLTRVQRAFIHILLNIKDTIDQTVPLPYIRILGLRKSKSFLLKNTLTPTITKVADAKNYLSDYGMQLLKQDIFCSNIYNRLLYEQYQVHSKDDYTHGIVFCE